MRSRYGRKENQREEVGIKGQNGFHSSTRGTLHEKRSHHCENVGFEESIAKRSGLRHADAYVLHQPGGTRSHDGAAGRTGEGQGAALQKNRARQESTKTQV